MVTVVFVSNNVSIRPYIFDDVVMHEVVKGGVILFYRTWTHEELDGVV